MKSIARIVVATLGISLGLMSVVFATPAFAAEHTVSSWTDLQSQFSNAMPGQTTIIVIASDISTSASSTSYLIVPDAANVVLDLAGHSLTIPAATNTNSAGIEVPSDTSFTVKSSQPGGLLNVSGARGGAGIGMFYGGTIDFGHITIESGSVVARGGAYAAGIGGGYYGGGESIVINGGTVTAFGGDHGAGIGNGTFQLAQPTPKIDLNGGKITATAGPSDGALISGTQTLSPGIGVGEWTQSSSSVTPIHIRGCATVDATGATGSVELSAGGGPAIGSSTPGVAAPRLFIDGRPHAGNPDFVASGKASGQNPGGVGSQITYSNLQKNSLRVSSTVGGADGAPSHFSVRCVAAPASLPNTGSSSNNGMGWAFLVGGSGLIFLIARRLISVRKSRKHARRS